jgi:hypothetical protein
MKISLIDFIIKFLSINLTNYAKKGFSQLMALFQSFFLIFSIQFNNSSATGMQFNFLLQNLLYLTVIEFLF